MKSKYKQSSKRQEDRATLGPIPAGRLRGSHRQVRTPQFSPEAPLRVSPQAPLFTSPVWPLVAPDIFPGSESTHPPAHTPTVIHLDLSGCLLSVSVHGQQQHVAAAKLKGVEWSGSPRGKHPV